MLCTKSFHIWWSNTCLYFPALALKWWGEASISCAAANFWSQRHLAQVASPPHITLCHLAGLNWTDSISEVTLLLYKAFHLNIHSACLQQVTHLSANMPQLFSRGVTKSSFNHRQLQKAKSATPSPSSDIFYSLIPKTSSCSYPRYLLTPYFKWDWINAYMEWFCKDTMFKDLWKGHGYWITKPCFTKESLHNCENSVRPEPKATYT